MVFFSLQPNPLVNAGSVVAFAGQSRRKVVIGKIRIQFRPGARHGMQPQVGNRYQQSDTFNPG
jgi:hypothetical protein